MPTFLVIIIFFEIVFLVGCLFDSFINSVHAADYSTMMSYFASIIATTISNWIIFHVAILVEIKNRLS